MARAGPVNMREVAEAARVCPATVSLVLRGSPKISPATRRRVQAAVAALGYRPNPYVAALMERIRARRIRRLQGVIALVAGENDPRGWRLRPDVPICARYFAGLSRAAVERGFRLAEFSVKQHGPSRLATVLVARGVTGVIVVPPVQEEEPALAALDWSRFCCVALGGGFAAPTLPVSRSHLAQGAALACEELWRRGCGRLGLYVPDWIERRLDYQWEAGFVAAHARRGRMAPAPPLREDWSAPGFLAWVRRHRLDAVLSVGIKPLGFLREAGRPVPGEVAYVTLDWSPGSIVAECAGIDQRPELVGAGAIDLVCAALNRNERGPSDAPRLLLTPGVWRDGATARPPSTPR